MKCKCLRCGNEWESRKEHPKACPGCKRYDWAIPGEALYQRIILSFNGHTAPTVKVLTVKDGPQSIFGIVTVTIKTSDTDSNNVIKMINNNMKIVIDQLKEIIC